MSQVQNCSKEAEDYNQANIRIAMATSSISKLFWAVQVFSVHAHVELNSVDQAIEITNHPRNLDSYVAASENYKLAATSFHNVRIKDVCHGYLPFGKRPN